MEDNALLLLTTEVVAAGAFYRNELWHIHEDKQWETGRIGGPVQIS